MKGIALLGAALLAATVLAAPLPSPAPERAVRTADPVGPGVAVYRLTPERERQAIAYSRARYRLHFVGFGWSLIVLGGILAARVTPRLRDWTERRSSRSFLQAALVLAPLGLIQGSLELPIEAARHQLALRFGLSVQSWPS